MVEVVEKNTYRIWLPDSMKIHPVFNISLLELATQDPFLGQRSQQLRPVFKNGEKNEVDEVLNTKMVSNQLKYLVKSLGYSYLK